MKIFSQRHPVILLTYFLMVLVCLMTMHPIIIGISLSGALCYIALLTSWSYCLKELLYYIGYTILITIMYASFAHNGVTPLFFYNDHAITKEAVFHGAMFGATFCTLAFWINAVLQTMQTNHFLFLFTKIHPLLGLFCAMCFRFFPYYKTLWLQNKRGQQGVHYFFTASRFDRAAKWVLLQLHTFVQAFDAVFWKPTILYSKGYQKKRTQFQLFSWHWRDYIIAGILLTLGITLTLSYNNLQFDYFPRTESVVLSPVIVCSTAVLCWLPAIIEGKGLIKWHLLQSKM